MSCDLNFVQSLIVIAKQTTWIGRSDLSVLAAWMKALLAGFKMVSWVCPTSLIGDRRKIFVAGPMQESNLTCLDDLGKRELAR